MTSPADLPESLAALLASRNVYHQRTGLPWVTLAYAQSLDGSIAAHPGTPLALSNLVALEITHRLRAMHRAILIGIGTLLADDPQLNVRLVPGDDPQPIVLDNQLRFPLEARLLMHGKNHPWIITSSLASPERKAALIQSGARIFQPSSGPVQLPDLLRVLGQEGIRSIMVEGGSQVITAFLKARLVNAVVITIAPLLVGGLHAVESALVGKGPSQQSPTAFPRIDHLGVHRIEDDLLVWGIPHWASEPET